MKYSLKYLPFVREGLRVFPPEIKRLVIAALEEISKNPYAGTPLLRELTGFWKYRAKRYRIIYKMRTGRKELVVFLIEHRESVYERLGDLMRNQ